MGRSGQKGNRQSPLFYAASIVYIRQGIASWSGRCTMNSPIQLYNHLPIEVTYSTDTTSLACRSTLP
jgi:hypothetical protein